MSNTLIEIEKYGIAVTTFWGGEEKKRCVQFTTNSSCYSQLKMKEAIKFLKESLKKLEKEMK